MANSTLVTATVGNFGYNKTWSLPGHTTTLPRLILQKRRVPTGKQTTSENAVTFLRAGNDANGNLLPSKGQVLCAFKEPVGFLAADRDALVADFRNFVNGDEFAAMLPGTGLWR